MGERPSKNLLDDVTTSETVCARVFHSFFPHLFRYAGGNRWEFWDAQKKTWNPDHGTREIKSCLRTNFTALLMQRAKVWQDYVQELGSNDHDVGFLIVTLMDLARKLQNQDYVRAVLKEAAEWYNYES